MTPLVTLICPIRNEEKYIESFLQTIFLQDYPKDKIQILLIDGLSTDRTREIINTYCSIYKNVILLDNPNKTVPYALNIGIRNATGDIIIRLDAHAIYPPNYISTLVYYLEKLNADNVGGVWETIPANSGLIPKSIAIALSTPFGVGNATYRVVKETNLEYVEVDTVPFGCYRKSENYSKLFKMFYQYGYFGPLVDIKLKRFTRLRRYIPTLFLLSLIIPIFLGLFWFPIFYISIFSGTIYFITLLTVSVYESLKTKNIILFPFILSAYFISHISYGLGYLIGFYDFVLQKKHKKLKKIEVQLSR